MVCWLPSPWLCRTWWVGQDHTVISWDWGYSLFPNPNPIPIPNFIPEGGGGKSNIKLVSWFQAACLQVASLVYSAVWLALFRLLKIRWLTRRKMWQDRAPIRRLLYWQQNVDFECLFTFKEFFKKFSFLKNLLHFPFTSTWSSWFVALILALAASFLYRYLFVKEWKQICTQLLYNKQ